MAEDLMSFSGGGAGGEVDGYTDDQDENAVPSVAPALVQSPVIKNSILKQSNKDNLIQLFTPVQKPVKGKLKVRFGHDSLLETPVVKQSGSTQSKVLKSPQPQGISLQSPRTQGTNPAPEPNNPDSTRRNGDGGLPSVPERAVSESLVDYEEEEDWVDRTSVLTKQDHQEYTQYATEVLHEIINTLPVTDDADEKASSTSRDVAELAANTSRDIDQNAASVDENTASTGRSVDENAASTGRSVDENAASTGRSVDENAASTGRDVDENAASTGRSVDENAVSTGRDLDENAASTGRSVDENAASTGRSVDESVTSVVETAMDVTEFTPQVPDEDADDVDFGSAADKILMETEALLRSLREPEPCTTSSPDVQTASSAGVQPSNDDARQSLSDKPSSVSEEAAAAPFGDQISDNKETEINHTEENMDFGEAMEVDEDEVEVRIGTDPEQPPAAAQTEVKGNSSTECVAAHTEGTCDTLNKNNFDHDQAALGTNVKKWDIETSVNGISTIQESETGSNAIANQKDQNVLDHAKRANPGHESSDEEFMSADEDMEVDEIKIPKRFYAKHDLEDVKQDEPVISGAGSTEDSPERIPPKIGYNFNFDDLDAMDPFATKTSVMNSPTPGGTDKTAQVTNVAKVPMTEVAQVGGKTETNSVENKNAIEESYTSLKSTNQLLSSAVSSAEENRSKMEIEPNSRHESPGNTNNNAEVGKDKTDSVQPVSLTFDDVEELDPFKPKSQIVNSPDYKICGELPKNLTSESADTVKTEVADECKGKIEKVTEIEDAVARTNTAGLEKEIALSKENIEVAEQVTENVPTLQKKETDLSPLYEPNIGESPELPKPKQGTYNFDDLDFDAVDPFQSRKQMMNSPDLVGKPKSDSTDPFQTGKQLMNSPKLKTDQQRDDKNTPQSVDQPKLNKVDTAEPALENCEPLEAHAKHLLVEESSESNTAATVSADLNTEKSNAANNVAAPSIDSKTLMDSDPCINSPPQMENTATYNFDNLDDIDPFKPKQQMQNSPMTSKSGCIDLDNLDDIDPFKPKTQMQNSPITSKSGSSDLDNLDDIDPFKPKKQMQNSPVPRAMNKDIVVMESSDADSSDKTMESEIKLDSFCDTDAIKPEQMVASPVLSKEPAVTSGSDCPDCVDPFKPKRQMQNSPTISKPSFNIFDDIDPFKSTKQMQNSPISSATNKESVEKSSSVARDTSVENVSQPKKMKISSASLDTIDPFKSLGKMAVSPRIPRAEEDAAVTESGVASPPTVSPGGVKDDLATSEAPPGKSLLDSDELEGANILEVQSVSRRGEQPKGSTVVDQFDGNFVIDDSQFVPATEVFSDPQVWDYLGQFGNDAAANTADTESTLSRMSLYVKFDPLVDAAPSNPRRISIRPAQLEKLKEFGLDDTLLLLGTPPKKRRQSILARSTAAAAMSAVPDIKHTQATPQAADVPQRAKPASFLPDAIDLILTVSPGPEDREKEAGGDGMREFQVPVMSSLLDANQPTEGLFQELKYTDQDVERMRQKFKFEFQGLSISKDKEHSEKVAQLQLQIDSLKRCVHEERDAKAGIIAAFDQLEETCFQLSAEKKQCEEKISEVKQEKNQAMEDLQNVEKSFSDLHKRYERLKTLTEQMLQNENTLKQTLADRLKDQKMMAEKVKSQTKDYEQKLDRKTQEAEKLKHQNETMHEKYEAQLKILQLKLEAAEKSVAQKTDENKELTEICDKLFKSVER